MTREVNEQVQRANGQNEEESSKRKLTGTFRALRHRNFQLFFAGQFISLTGTWMQSVAQSWLVYRLTGSVVLLGLIGFASQIPVFFLAPFGGVAADRYNRQKILVITQSSAMVIALVMAILTLTGTIQVWHLFIFAVCFGLANSFDIPTRQAFVSEMVAREDLLNAIALNSSMFNGARIVGPAIAGILVALVGEGWCFLGNSVSYIAVIIGILLMKITPVVRERKGSTFSNIAEGFSFVAKTAPIRGILLLLGLVSLMGMPYAVLMPIFADKILGGGSDTLGYLMGGSGLGAVIATLILASRREVFGLGRWVSYASGGLGISLILFSFSSNFWLSLVLLIPVGFSMMLQMSSSNTLIQAMVPDEIRGRVMSVYSMMFMGMSPLGALLAGSLAEILGAPKTVALGGLICLFGAIIFRWRMPRHREKGQQMIIALQMTAGDPASKASFQEPAFQSEKLEK